MPSSSNSVRASAWTLPLIIGVAACASAAATLVLRSTKSPQTSRPPRGVPLISHLTMHCKDISKSLDFYCALGFLLVSRTNDSILLSLPKSTRFAPFLLLKQVEAEGDNKEVKNTGTQAGYRKIGILVPSIIRFSNHLKKTLNVEPVAKPATDMVFDQMGKQRGTISIAAWQDPDGTLVEVIETHDSSTRRALYWMHMLGALDYPLWLHVNINATDFEQSYKAYRQLGMIETASLGRVRNKLYKPLGIADPGIASQTSMLRLPNDQFQVNLVEWEDPKTALPEDGLPTRGLISIGLVVDDHIDRVPVGWEAEDITAVEKTLPLPLGAAKIKHLLDPDGIAIELVQF